MNFAQLGINSLHLTNNYISVKGYKRFLVVFTAVLLLYVMAEMNRPKPIDWKITLSREDKNPYGGYILYNQLADMFPTAGIQSLRLPVYNQLHNTSKRNTAYILIARQLDLTAEDVDELLNYTLDGNYVFLASADFSRPLLDSLKFKASRRFDLVNADSTTINLKNPALHTNQNYGFKRMTVDGYLNVFDTARTIILGNNHLKDVNFVQVPYGEGAFFVHVLPVCFSNYFMLTSNNADYTAKVLSYLPTKIHTVYWDEYYKLGPVGSANPLRYVLGNTWLKWSFRIGLLAMILFVIFGGRRRQRIIPIIPPLRNSTLDFVQTVGNVYFNQRDNKNIALKKISYFLEHVRSAFFLSTNPLNNEFVEAFSVKSDMDKKEVFDLVNLIQQVQNNASVDDETLLKLNKRIDHFYDQIHAYNN